MTTLLIVSLACASLYFGHGWLDSKAENSQLRTSIAALKRQLARRER
jgi:uncharacterized membrane protein YciS (DUF1049 family)